MGDRPITTRRYVDRLGRPITDQPTIEARFVAEQLSRLTNAAARAGKPRYVQVDALAKATRLTAARVVEIMRAYDMWLWGLIETDEPIETWEAFLDGE